MTVKISDTEIKRSFLFVAAIAVFVALLIRNSGLYPVVFADEYSYSRFSRLLPLADSAFPDYIYLAIYRLTNICGDGFLNCARILNAMFFVAAMPFIYLTARRVCTTSVASLVALLAVLGPINTYTAYYMPEALYFLSFWLVTWFVLRLDNSSSLRSWCIAGILLGLSALVKPHSLFILPALVAYIFYINREIEDEWVPQAFRNASVFVAFVFLSKIIIAYVLAGKAGLTIFGPSYTSIASSTVSNFQRYVELFELSSESVKGHMLAICLMFGLPTAFAIYASINSVASKSKIKTDQKISFFSLAVLVNLILVVGLFTASVANGGPYESVARLHMRYYNFALPLLLVIAASQLSSESNVGILKWRALAAFPIGAAILYAVYTHLSPYTPSLVDSPELRGFTAKSTVFYVLSGTSFFSLALWVYEVRMGAKSFIFFFVPLAVVFSTVYVNQELRNRLIPDVYDKAGIFTKQYLPNEDLSKVVVVGSDLAELFRSLFYLDNPNASLDAISNGAAIDLSKLPSGKEWILVVGDHPFPENTLCQLPMNGFVLARTTETNTIDFKKSSWPCIISKAQGLSSAEPWGTWSSSNVVTFEFSMPLPEHFKVHLMAGAFGTNIGGEFVAHMGDSVIRFTLGASPEEKVLEFSNLKRSRTIRIDVPSPISPKELGMSADERRLGIAFVKLWVERL